MRTDQVPSRLVTSGLVELAAGALSGWVYTLAREDPERARALGIQSSARIRQWHLDLIMMGTATIAAGVASPGAPPAVRTALGIGAWTNAMSFLPLAFSPDVDEHPAYRAFALASFVATSVGFAGMAASAVRARRRAGRA
jgi:hypothetical protein